MYDLHHMLNGNIPRQLFQDWIRKVQQKRFARDVEAAAQAERKSISPLRALLATIVNLMTH